MTSQFQSIAPEIESSDFRFQVNQAAGLEAFSRLVHEHKAFKNLREFAKNADGQAYVLDRIDYLSRISTDARYKHPFDTALAAYLMALDSVSARSLHLATLLVAQLPRLWWSGQIARAILVRDAHKDTTMDVVEGVISIVQQKTVESRLSTVFCRVNFPANRYRYFVELKGNPIRITEATKQTDSSHLRRGNRTEIVDVFH